MPSTAASRFDREFQRVIAEIHAQKQMVADQGITALTAETLNAAVQKGMKKDFLTVDYSTPDAQMLQRLTADVWQFSVAKNYQQMRDITLMLKDETGKARSFEDFKTAVSATGQKFNATWLQTEYDTAVGSATMAARWTEFQANKDILPNLRYETVGDRNVRNEHRLLDGITRPIDDQFWTTHYPPNGWKCRCSARAVGEKAKKTQSKDIPDISIDPMFSVNLSERGLVFPPKHPYYTGLPKDLLEQSLVDIPETSIFNVAENWKDGNQLRVHSLHDAEELGLNMENAQSLIENYGKNQTVDLMPSIGSNLSAADRKKIFGKSVFEGQTPEIRFGSELWASAETSVETLTKDLAVQGKRAQNIVLRFGQADEESAIKEAVKAFVQKHPFDGRKIVIINKDNILEF